MAQEKEFAETYPVPMSGLNMVNPIVAVVSFATGEQAQNRIYVAGRTRIRRVRGVVTTALAATDAGTITIQNAAGVTMATITIPASTTVNTEFDSGIITNVNRDIERDTHFRLVSAKPTAGGRCLVSVEYSILPER